jgi:hypothetical protein
MEGIELVTEDEVRQRVLNFIAGGEHWTFVLGRGEEATGLTMIEERFYSGEANEDFSVVFGPMNGRMVSMAFGHKRRMTAGNLAELAQELADNPKYEVVAPTKEQLEEKDILFLAGRKEATELATRFFFWIKGPVNVFQTINDIFKTQAKKNKVKKKK